MKYIWKFFIIILLVALVILSIATKGFGLFDFGGSTATKQCLSKYYYLIIVLVIVIIVNTIEMKENKEILNSIVIIGLVILALLDHNKKLFKEAKKEVKEEEKKETKKSKK